MKYSVYQIHILLKDSKPRIWRRILINSTSLLPDLHLAIQASMGWLNYHLHQFIKDDINYSPRTPDDIDYWDDSYMIDYKNTIISDLLTKEKDKIMYEYDFGDDWEHYITLEKIHEMDGKLPFPICIKGKMNCPPEDSHGIWGYMDMLEIIKNPKHKDYKEFSECFNEDFNPEIFDIKEANTQLVSNFLAELKNPV